MRNKLKAKQTQQSKNIGLTAEPLKGSGIDGIRLRTIRNAPVVTVDRYKAGMLPIGQAPI